MAIIARLPSKLQEGAHRLKGSKGSRVLSGESFVALLRVVDEGKRLWRTLKYFATELLHGSPPRLPLRSSVSRYLCPTPDLDCLFNPGVLVTGLVTAHNAAACISSYDSKRVALIVPVSPRAPPGKICIATRSSYSFTFSLCALVRDEIGSADTGIQIFFRTITSRSGPRL